jgi:hypothetical protein
MEACSECAQRLAGFVGFGGDGGRRRSTFFDSFIWDSLHLGGHSRDTRSSLAFVYISLNALYFVVLMNILLVLLRSLLRKTLRNCFNRHTSTADTQYHSLPLMILAHKPMRSTPLSKGVSMVIKVDLMTIHDDSSPVAIGMQPRSREYLGGDVSKVRCHA